MSTHPLRRQYASGTAPVARRELWAWAMYDFANSGYTTVVITAIFNAYFVSVIASSASWATLVWTSALSVSYLVIMLSAPLLGRWADAGGRKRQVLWVSTGVCVLATAGLGWCGPGDLWLALVLVVVSNIAYGTGENVIAAFLPELADEHSMGRLSGYGWALGYLGGLLLLGICLWWVQTADQRGSSMALAVPQTLWITAVAFALAALPTLLLLRERVQMRSASPVVWHGVLRSILQSVQASAGLTDLRRFLLCVVCYQAGVGTVITIAAIYTQEALGFSTADSIQLILVVNITAAIGALLFGQIQDRLGHRRTLAITLLLWLLALGLLACFESRALVWLAANIAGLSLGASQSAGRAMVGYLCPEGRQAEVFGLWGLAVKLAMILGPLSYGLSSWLSDGNHRMAMMMTSIFFIAGLLLLARVNVERGRARCLVQNQA